MGDGPFVFMVQRQVLSFHLYLPYMSRVWHISFAIIALLCNAVHVCAQEYWVQKFGGLGGDRVHDVKTGADDHVYVAGEFTAGMEVDGQPMNAVGAADGFVAKLDPFGELEWTRSLGGAGIDRCWKLFVATDGTLAVTGQYVGPANLLGTSVPSTSGMWHAFVAKLDASTGDALWVRTAGGTDGPARPNGVTIAPDGSITMAGEFSGTAVFQAGTLTSMYDPILQAPGSDVFVASYAANGDALWLQQGSAEFTDKAVDVVSDAESNIYVCGQFSDTIMFDLAHTNAMVNAIFLLKLDPAGNEVWFRVCGGGIVDIVHDMQLTSTGELLLCGDLRGSMFFLDGSTDVIEAEDDYACFLLLADTEGEHVRHSVLGSDSPVSAKAIDQRADTVAVLGTFQCQFADLTEHYDADGLFMATGPQDLFVSKHVFSTLQLHGAQQFGGQWPKQAGGITSTTDSQVLFCGAFEGRLVFPSTVGLVGDYCNYGGCGAGTSLTFHSGAYEDCGGLTDAVYMAMYSEGERDGILANAVITGRAPYSFWNPAGGVTPCGAEQVPMCMARYSNETWPCTDTLVNCLCYEVTMVPPYYGFPSQSAMAWGEYEQFDVISICTAPDLDFIWSTGETDAHIDPPDGWTSCTVSAVNGCWEWTDSVFVINDCDWPWISDNIVVGTDWDQPYVVTACSPFWAWSSNVPEGYVCQWIDYAEGDTLVNDSIFVDNAGSHAVRFISPYGCVTYNHISVDMPVPPILPAVDSTDHQLFLSGGWELDGDTITTCPMSCVGGYVEIAWFNNGQPVPMGDSIFWTAASCGVDAGADPDGPMGWGVPGTETGWMPFTLDVHLHDGPCGPEQLDVQIVDSVYVHVVQVPNVTAIVPSYICAGDTLVLLASCVGCDSIVWSDGDGLWSNAAGDTAWCTVPGGVMVNGYHTERGVTCSDFLFANISSPLAPGLQLLPPVICPGDSALLSTWTAGTDIQWTGSSGVLPDTTSSFYVHGYGDYYLSLTDANGCVVSGGPVTLSAFGSPYLLVEPDQVMCPGEQVSISVLTTDPEAIQWNPPLVGSDTIQWITEPGTYSCDVTSCGQTQTLTVQVVGGYALAEIVDPGPFSACEGQTFTLSGVPGQALYIWSPMDTIAPSIMVDSAGSYQLIVADPFGCFDTSAVVVVELTAADTLTLGLDTAICAGQVVTLTATGPYANWLWSTGATTNSTTVDQPGLYTLYAYDAQGCVSIGNVVIGALACADTTWTGTIPNVLTPNGDGANDGWGVDPNAPYELVIIYNRWGNEVFRADPRTRRWFGRDQRGNELPDGVYFYALTAPDKSSNREPHTGYIQLVRR
jgi:gliding motility-associated-like protein